MSKKLTLKEAQEAIQELTQALQLERADAVNLRRRHEEEIAKLRSSVKTAVVKELLPVIDNFDRAMKHHPMPDLEKLSGEGDQKTEWIKGVNKIYQQFEKTLANMGVQRIKTVGEPFDPHMHEAVGVEEDDPETSSGQVQPDTITEELQAGYRIGDDVIRHAMVKVKH